MLTWFKKLFSKTTIQCPVCEWRPAPNSQWGCDCGNLWDSFQTNAQCPQCQKQWETTQCFVCKEWSPHQDWYHSPEQVQQAAAQHKAQNPIFYARKQRVQQRLYHLGIHNKGIGHLEEIDHSQIQFRSAYEVGARMVILYVVSQAAHQLEERAYLAQWLQKEYLWDHVAPSEQAFLLAEEPTQKEKILFSWMIESALALGWCLQLLPMLPPVNTTNNAVALVDFQRSLPELGLALAPFLEQVQLRDLAAIYEEYRVSEAANYYLQDCLELNIPNRARIDGNIAYERHRAFFWLIAVPEEDNAPIGHLWDQIIT